ncbi:OLC1v1030210C1 [Oldenlandia corymbosa var. corymbosa]|uniref:OLC1v1030210C1 n=1 Tax=Oldenlandia corymbosa var. corymbosa TaxID=529605 RepID=A0AAV1CGA2_OLDCO|nr:OLC1v1030210C1 [Oldenlandia corymbosa var. corymbosa]
MEPWRDWSGLLPELLAEISMRIPSIEEFMAFRGVCSPWRAAANKDKFVQSCPAIPLLMLLGRRCGRFGWLFTLDNDSEEANLLNPFSRSLSHLSNLTNFPGYAYYKFPNIRKAVLSANPSHTSDFVVLMVIHRDLVFWRPSESTWTGIEWHSGDHVGGHAFADAKYYNDKFYAIDFGVQVWVWDSSLKVAHLLFRVDHPPLSHFRKTYLVESSNGELLVVWPDGVLYDEVMITDVEVIQLDVAQYKWKKITSLGKDAIFLVGGNSAAICIAGSTSFPDLISSNCIYFANDCGK